MNQGTSSTSHPYHLHGLALLFFFSGVAGLSYELTWVRYLGQVFGASTPAVSATISIFFLGLALGSVLGGRWFSKTRHPLRSYALLELSIGLVALLVPWLFSLAQTLLVHYFRPGEISTWQLLLLSTALLVVPTTLLGATFPAMSAVARGSGSPVFATGFFYGFNTIGAVAGCLLVSFWWLPSLGQAQATRVMALLNLLLAGFAYWRYRMTRDEVSVPERHHTETSTSTDSSLPSIARRPAMLLAGMSGFLAMGVELLWTRALSLSFPGSAYVFALVLASYLIGLGLGSLWLSHRSRRKAPQGKMLIILYLLVAFGTGIPIYFFPRFFPWSYRLLEQGVFPSLSLYMGWLGGATVLSMLLATFAMGAALPLLIGLASRESNDNTSQVVGRLYAWNTIGGVGGSLFANYVLLPTPQLGLVGSVALLAVGYLLMSLMAACLLKVPFLKGQIPTEPEQAGRSFTAQLLPFRLITASLLLVGSLVVLTGFYPEPHPHKAQGKKRIFHKDTSSASFSVYEDSKGVRSLIFDNNTLVGTTAQKDAIQSYRLGLIPLALHSKPRKALLLGFGTGATLAAMASRRQVTTTCIEPYKPLLKLSNWFASTNFRVMNHPQIKVLNDDVHRYLLRRGKRFDVVVQGMSAPSEAGFGSMYSLEYFKASRLRLNAKGIFVTWLPLNKLSPREVASIVQSFLKVYPAAEAWVGSWSTSRPVLGLVGSQNKAVSQRATLEKRLQRQLKQLLLQGGKKACVKTQRPVDCTVSRRLLKTSHLRRWAGKAPLNRFEHPLVEFSSPQSIMKARLHKSPLALQNIRKIRSIRSLLSTPWASIR